MKRIPHLLTLLFTLLTSSLPLYAQEEAATDRNVRTRLEEYFKQYTTLSARISTPKLDSLHIDHTRRTLRVYAGAAFAQQPFTPERVAAIRRDIQNLLPGPVNYYTLSLFAGEKPVEQLVPNALVEKRARDKNRLWDGRRHDLEHPWVKRTSLPYPTPTQGLASHHLAVWQSHGNYYKNAIGAWAWQRPRLWCTTEDLFTRSFVVPFLIPMLENAGAVAYTPRERDAQHHEVIVDNDQSSPGSIYFEEKSKKSPWKQTPLPGFSHRRATYSDGEAPFVTGTARFAPTATKKKKSRTLATWIPDIPETGSYAVYVSYQTLPGAVPDAHYTVFHKGGATEFSVNQQMGGGTWVYLGTFEFDKGQNDYGFVALSNESAEKGIVCADGVRFGGGMGNIERGGQVSGRPRYLEGARYWAQWAGMPYEVYAGRKGENDYADDINTRSLALNHLSGGSPYNPVQKGLSVPFELTLGVHSDAGFSREDSLVGTLGIYTTTFGEPLLGSGRSRLTSRDLCDLVLSGLSRDLPGYTGRPWARRAMWDRNYSESRLPSLPSMILETLSHQNFADMKLGHEPDFKFAFARSVYKSLLRHTATMHGRSYTVQPLPPNHFAVQFEEETTANPRQKQKKKGKSVKESRVRLTWQPVTDPLEPSAQPTGYVVYTRIGQGGFDGGVYTATPALTLPIESGILYSFRVTAVNEGGESFPTETLVAYRSPESERTMLIVNAFDRLSGPATIETADRQGFDLAQDAGVGYLCNDSYSGAQISFDRRYIGRETSEGLGYSGSELEGVTLAGNTFDYPSLHGRAIRSVKGAPSFVSCSDEAVEEGIVRLTDYPLTDLIFGFEKQGGHSAMTGEEYGISPALLRALDNYLAHGGRLMASGAYLCSADEEEVPSLFRATFARTLPASDGSPLVVTNRAGLTFTLPRALGEKQIPLPCPEVLTPAVSSGAFTPFVYDESGESAAVAWQSAQNTARTFTLAFPFECIREEEARIRLMGMVLRFLGE